MVTYTSKVSWEKLRSIDSSTFTGSYQAVGTPFVYPSYICKMVNNSSVLVTISFDGVNDYDVAPANSFWLYDEGKSSPNANYPALPVGTQIYVKGSAGTGLVYLVTQYIVQI
jgi:hypothetical protein